MLSRRTARAVAESYAAIFSMKKASDRGRYSSVPTPQALYDFLFDNDYSAWFCNAAQKKKYTLRSLKEFIMRLHTGETLFDATRDWTWQQRQTQGQIYLENLAEDILNHWHQGVGVYKTKQREKAIQGLIRYLELDGYNYSDGRLLAPEEDTLDTQEEAGVVRNLYRNLSLNNEDTAFHHLELSEEHYVEERWDDSIGNSRKFLECVLQEIAAAHSFQFKRTELPEGTYKWPARVREYLEESGLLESKERKTLAEIYGLLSETGGHPYMARHDQARLLRHLSLTLAQFVLLRYKGMQ